MKKIFFLLLTTAVVFTSCKENNQETVDKVVYNQEDYQFFGQEFELSDQVKDKEYMLAKYKDLKQGDTLKVAFFSDIQQVCQKKGCWMSLALDQDQASFVKFKDYGFFAPMNSSGHKAIVDGKAFVSIIPIDELKHYAKDAGKSQQEIDQITEDKVVYNFLADGIAIEKEKQESVLQ
ncbi:DUF4920 domain-containing protein [Myroides odoratimimus]|uniref:DUF4920 domain-containing protein n=1 Tax=Myroides odoratimimus TaxID=76832 RepID=UPI001CE10E0A|nr:DUF4920 domain-containing protein [Myroides odoratimimus]MCA4806966.1 DUF4920 domain-containing protein [Myroides odoratimimus]